MIRSSIIVMSLFLIIIISSIHYQSYAEETNVINGELTASCGIMPFGGQEVGTFELKIGPQDRIESLKISMIDSPGENKYIVGFTGLGSRPFKLPDALVKVDEYRSDGRVMIIENKSMPSFSQILFVAERDPDSISTGWSLINITGTEYLDPPIAFPKSDKFEYENVTIIHELDVDKNAYELGERIEIKPTLLNIGSENATIIHGSPPFIVGVYTPSGDLMWFHPTVILDIGIGAELQPGVPYGWREDDIQKTYDLRLCKPGEYVIVSQAWFSVEEQTEQGYSSFKQVKIYAEPVTIEVSSVPEVDNPPIVISKVEPWGPAYFVEGVNICGWGKSSISDALQWAEIRNTTNEEVITLPGWNITVTNISRFSFGEGLTLAPKESCIVQTGGPISVHIAGPGGFAQPSGYNGSAVILEYSVEIDKAVVAYKDSTPELSDTYGDTRNWQLIDGEWVFKNGKLPDADRTTLTKTTEDGSVIVNLILAEEITAPTDSKFRVGFIDAATQQLMNNVSYQMVFEGTSMRINTSSVPLALVSKDNPFKREWSIDGIARNGTDTQLYAISSPGSLNITIRILGINNEPLAQALNAKFSTLATSGFPEYLQITEVELNSDEGNQWIELYNPTDRPINASRLVLKQLAGEWATERSQTPLETGFGKVNFTMNSVVLQPREYRVFEISSKDDSSGERFLTKSVISLIINEREVSRTPELTDSDADSRTWQLEAKRWVFDEATPARAIPEFPISLSVVVAIGLIGALITLRVKVIQKPIKYFW